VADGGEGSLDAALSAGYRAHTVMVSGPLGDAVQAVIGLRGDEGLIELAQASGLGCLGGRDPDCLRSTSYGTGEMIRAALDHGCRRLVLAVGGSACTDGGAGMLQALGARLLDVDGADLAPGGAALERLGHVDLSTLDPRLASTHVTLATDVDNPLLGPCGAATVYGPQKGARPPDIAVLESGLSRWTAAVDPGSARLPGAGAAGGVGYGAMAGLGAVRRSGVEVFLELTRFDGLLDGASLVITGEGSLDHQTLAGKAVMGVTRAARARGVPTVAVCGTCRLDASEIAAAGLSGVFALTNIEPDVSRSIRGAGGLLERVAPSILRSRPVAT
jgi:glycerate kinase